jgi:hypothetical protein
MINPQDLSDVELSVDDLSAYAIRQGWRKVLHPNERLLVFEGVADDEGNPIRLVLPSHKHFGDALLRFAEAINLLASVQNSTPQAILEDLRREAEV